MSWIGGIAEKPVGDGDVHDGTAASSKRHEKDQVPFLLTGASGNLLAPLGRASRIARDGLKGREHVFMRLIPSTSMLWACVKVVEIKCLPVARAQLLGVACQARGVNTKEGSEPGLPSRQREGRTWGARTGGPRQVCRGKEHSRRACQMNRLLRIGVVRHVPLQN